MRQLSTTVDALKSDQEDMRQLSTDVDALKRDQNDMYATVDALQRDQDDMYATVEALERDQDDMYATVDALQRDQDDMSATVDALKRDLDKEMNRTAALEQCLDETSKTQGDHDSRENSEPLLLVADREAIIQVDITSGSKVTLPLVGVGQPYALDYDPLTDYVYWSDYRNKQIKRARRDGSGMETIIDTGNRTISVAKKDGSSPRTLLTSPDIAWPYGLVLDPRNGLMYWTDYSKSGIYRAEMDGSDQTTITADLRNPDAITIDFKENRLYYRHQEYGIYSSDLLGNDIRRVLYEDGKWVVDIAVDEDFVYWSSIWPESSSSPWQGKIGKRQVKPSPLLYSDSPGIGS
uniref:DUF5050 domain-containing protein n=1 Tax=Branchiostoma floridae TaxID=7739 RepID=C3YSX9_BRAFL|eukprot:XP_002600631.1 hypothetical protein BRAFLDRAFT_95145 [Branchiostoma floridae]